jgi:phosphate/sulfate permease
MLSVGIASFLFILTSSFFGVPISGTHTVVGALIGAGIAGLGSKEISWKQLQRIVLSWFVSPILSSFLCFCLMILVAVTTLNGVGMSLKPRLFNLTFISGTVFCLITYMVIILI